MQYYSLQGHILDSKRIMEPVKMFWIFEKENIYPKEIRALRLLLMYYWDRIAHYPDVEDLRLLDTEPMSYYYTVQHSLDCKENAFLNDIYHIWRVVRISVLNSKFSSHEVDVEDACKVYDLMMSQLRSVIYNQEIEIFDWYYRDDFYEEANKVIDIVINMRYDNDSCLRKWPYIGAIAYYWDLVFKRPMELKEYKEKNSEYKAFKQRYEGRSDTQFIDFQLTNVNQNYSNIEMNMMPREIEFIKDVLYALRDIKLYGL